MVTSASPATRSSTGLAFVFDAHSLRWRAATNLLLNGADSEESDASNRHKWRLLQEPFCPSRARMWTTDDLPLLAADDLPRLATDYLPRLATDDLPRPCGETRAEVERPVARVSLESTHNPRASDPRSPSDSSSSSTLQSPPAIGAAVQAPIAAEATPAAAAPAEASEAAAGDAAADGRRRAGPFLGDELLGMEQLTGVVRGTLRFCCSDDSHWPHGDGSFLSSNDRCEIRGLWDPTDFHMRLEQLLTRNQKHVTVTSLHIPVTLASHRELMRVIWQSCASLRSLCLQAQPERGWCPLHEDLKEPRDWGWKKAAQLEQVGRLITGCPHLRSLHFNLNNKYIDIREEVAPLLSRLAHLSLPLRDLPPYLLPHLSSLRSLRLSLSAPRHPLLLSDRPFHSLSRLSLLHLSLGSLASGLSEPLSPDLFAGLGPSLRSLTFLVCAKQKGPAEKRRKYRDGRVDKGGDGGGKGQRSGGGSGKEVEEDGGWVGDEWGREDEVVCWVPGSVWSLSRLQQLTTNVGGAWESTGLNALFPPHASHSTPPSASCSCCCCSSSSSSSSLHQHQQHHHMCLASLPSLTSLSLPSHRTFPPCLSSLSSLSHLSIPLAAPLLFPHSLALFSHCPRLTHLHACGEGPTEPEPGLTEPPFCHEAVPFSGSLCHVTLTGTAGVIPLAGRGEQMGEHSGEGDVGQGARGEGEDACGADGAAACFFPLLEELVLRSVRSRGQARSEQQAGSEQPAQQQQQPQQAHTLAFMGHLPCLTHLAIDDTSHPPLQAPTILPALLPSLTFLRVHSPPPAPLPVLPKLRALIVGSYPHTSHFLSALSLFPSLSSLRILNLSMHNYHSALSCPPSLKCLQICHSATPLLPDSLRLFASLTRLDLFQCVPLRALPSFLSAFSPLTHFSFDRDCNHPVVVPVGLEEYIQGKRWAQEKEEGERRKGGMEEQERRWKSAWMRQKERRRIRFQSVFRESSLSKAQKEEQREWWSQVGKEEEEEGACQSRRQGARGEENDKQQQQQQQAEQGAKLVRGAQKVDLRAITTKQHGTNQDPQNHSRLPAEELQHGRHDSSSMSSRSANTSSSTSTTNNGKPPPQLSAEVLQAVLQRLQGPMEEARVSGVCREWRRWYRLHTSCFAFALHPLLLSWVPLALLQPPPSSPSSSSSSSSTSSSFSLNLVCRSGSRRREHGMTSLNGPPLFSSPWHPADSPFWVIHSPPSTRSFSLLPSSSAPFTIPPPIAPCSLSTCFTHLLHRWRPLSPIWFSPVWFASLPSPASLARTIALYPSLSALVLPLVSTAARPLRPSHVRPLLSAAAAQPALSSLSVLLEDGYRDYWERGYGREEWLKLGAKEREREMRRWWGEANGEVERGLFAVVKRCRGLQQLHVQGENLANRLKLPANLFHRCPQLTALSLPLSSLPSSLLLLSRLTSLSLALPADHMPPQFAHSAPLAHLRSLRALSLHVQHIISFQCTSMDASSWSNVSPDLLLGLPSLSSLSLSLPTGTMPDSFSCLTALTRLETNLWIPGLEEEQEEEEGEVEAEEGRSVGEEDEVGGGDGDEEGDGEDKEEEKEKRGDGLHHTAGPSRVTDEGQLPLSNLTSLSLSHYTSFPPLIRHLTHLTSLSLPCVYASYHDQDSTTPSCSLHHGLSHLTRLQELFIGSSSRCDHHDSACLWEISGSACIPRLPRLRRVRVQCPDETVPVARLLANVAPSLEQLDVRADYRNYSAADLGWTALVFPKLKVLQLVTSGPPSYVDMALFPALEHMALAGSRSMSWGVTKGFSSNLHFLHLTCARLSGYGSDPRLTQLTSLTTLVVDNADCRDLLACLSAFSSLRTLRLSNLTRGCSEPYLTCPPLLATLQICRSDLPHLPSSLAKFARLTRLDLLHWRCLHSLPTFLSSFTSLRHFRVTCDGPRPLVPACLEGFLRDRDWYEYSPCDSFE
ncbi:hypothetical protein CLOP_g5346 [Closterium sp. NIES-67]|nr:hypothetical protein CLOP_g5346 [Closterium sp. NIES-67]